MTIGLNDWEILWYTNIEGGDGFIPPWVDNDKHVEHIHSICFYCAKQGVTIEFDEINGIRGGSKNVIHNGPLARPEPAR